MPSTTEELLHRFYQAFNRRDAEAMAGCYHREVVFSDPVFPELRGERAGHMWRMLCQQAKRLEITHRIVSATADSAQVHWEARYPFSAAQRPVHNVVEASFELRDGLIVRHRDQFDFFRWSRQALGLPGLLLGWSPLLQRMVQLQAGRGLDAWISRRYSAA